MIMPGMTSERLVIQSRDVPLILILLNICIIVPNPMLIQQHKHKCRGLGLII